MVCDLQGVYNSDTMRGRGPPILTHRLDQPFHCMVRHHLISILCVQVISSFIILLFKYYTKLFLIASDYATPLVLTLSSLIRRNHKVCDI